MFWAPTKPCKNSRRGWDNFFFLVFLSPCHPEQSPTWGQWKGFMSNHPFRLTLMASNLRIQWLKGKLDFIVFQDSKEQLPLPTRGSLRWQCMRPLRNGRSILPWISTVTSLWEVCPQEMLPANDLAELLTLEVILCWTRNPNLSMIC